MSKSKTPAKKTREAPEGAKAPASKQKQPEIVLISYAVIATKTAGGAIKTLIEDHDAGKALLKDIYVSLNQGKPYFNEEHAILVSPDNFSHAFLVQEKVVKP